MVTGYIGQEYLEKQCRIKVSRNVRKYANLPKSQIFLFEFVILICNEFAGYVCVWDCVKNGMESLGLSQKDAQSRNKWRRRIKGATS